MKPEDRDLLAMVAGQIAGGLASSQTASSIEFAAEIAVSTAEAILAKVDAGIQATEALKIKEAKKT